MTQGLLWHSSPVLSHLAMGVVTGDKLEYDSGALTQRTLRPLAPTAPAPFRAITLVPERVSVHRQQDVSE